DVRGERLGRSHPRGRHERLGGEVEDPVRLDLGDGVERRRRVAQVALVERDGAGLQVLDVLRAAPPAPDAVQLEIVPGEEVVHEMAARETGDAGDQDATHADSSGRAWGVRSPGKLGGRSGTVNGRAGARGAAVAAP